MAEPKHQYYSVNELIEISKELVISDLKLINTDTYSDDEIYAAILETGKPELLACAAIQMCVVGFGNKAYGSFNYGGITYDIIRLFNECNVKYDLPVLAKTESHELTPRRLQRFFRQHVKMFLENNRLIKPYLWRKYSKRVEKYRTTTFPGAESLLTDPLEINYLIETYSALDARNGTKICDRIYRVLEARGLKDII